MSKLQTCRRYMVCVIGLAGMFFAVNRCFWFASLPQSSFARRCGNCFLGAVGVPLELGALGLLMILASTLRVQYTRTHIVALSAASIGVLLTPAVLGVPMFAVGFALLSSPVAFALYRRAAAVLA